jgi:ubiquitin carboxyl-terminal hydrolase 20/33
MNLSSQRVWCYLCESEVFLQSQHNRYHQRANSIDGSDNARRIFQYNHELSDHRGYDSEKDEEEEVDYQGQLNGLVGLKNIANTCYMNSAIQALSNSPPLTGYFLECGNVVQNSTSRTKVGLAKSYHRLIRDMWLNKRRGYIVPDEIIRGISTIHPIFRGYQQHDTQEFLRCFMDQLHEELKEVTPPPPDNTSIDEEMNSPCSTPSPSQSEAEEYETCDSGVSEQSSLSDEMPVRSPRKISRSPSPLRSVSTATMGSSILTNRTGSNASLTSVHSNSQQTAKNENVSKPKAIHRSIISDIFDGKLLSSVQCLTCDRVSTREETFQDLSLPIPGRDYLTMLHQSQNPIGMPPINPVSANGQTCTDVVYQVQDSWMWWLWNWVRSFFYGPAVTLHDCMNAFFSADELKGDNMYSCEKCNKLRNGVKFSRVLALPEMLCVHLKRFRHDLSYSSKISSPVIFPLSGLDMRQYLHKDCKSKVSTYDLTAIICHHGTVGSGHYICYAKHAPTDKWYEFDDQTVTQVSSETVQNCEAYVLFYQKTNPQMAHVRSQAQEIINSMPYSPTNPSDIKFFISRQWLNRFNTFAEPGPIDNWSILCQHGNLLPNKAANLSDLLVPLPQALWDFFYAEFGGGPVTNHPIECDTCKTRAEDLERRQKNELLMFSELRDEFQYQDQSSTLLAMSMMWFRKWQAFARCETTDEPGPINNTTIALQSDTLPIRNVRPGSDYAQINLKLWKFFFDIYGGGPAIVLRGASEFNKVEKESDLADTTENLSLNDNDDDEANGDDDETNEGVDELNNNEEEIKNSTTTTTSILKPVKTVSFEDTKDLSESEDESNSGSAANSTVNGVVHKNDKNGSDSRKKSKKVKVVNIKPLDPREKKRRDTQNGLFGAEGKFLNFL